MQIQVSTFALESTFFSGQAFRFRNDNGLTGIIQNSEVRLAIKDSVLTIETLHGSELPMQFWKNYFALDVDYAHLISIYKQDAILAKCVNYAPGIRILRQDFFETLISFIVSQNNNIPRISKIIEGLCDSFGIPIPGSSRKAFPTPETLAKLTESDLSHLKTGYRAPYIISAAKDFVSGKFSSIKSLPTPSARKLLLSIHGVGPKVAECVLLFGLSRFDAFPIDVWMRRAMQTLFPTGLPPYILPTAGIAQQYIFHYARSQNIT